VGARRGEGVRFGPRQAAQRIPHENGRTSGVSSVTHPRARIP
jgi:hypothetical protein